MAERKRRDVKFVANAAILDGVTYTLEGVQSATVWTLALEGLVARLKRAQDPAEVYKFIAMEGIHPKAKKDRWVECWAEAAGESYEDCLETWKAMSRPERQSIRNHPEVYAVFHKEAAPLDSLAK